nr:helix-turn-helix domain-containing protein [Halorussus sp. JP-T4]
MHRFAGESDAVETYRLLHWNATGAGIKTLLFYVEGDRAAYKSELDASLSAGEYTVTPVDDSSFYVHVVDESTDAGTGVADALARDGVVVASPLDYLRDGRVRFTIVGESAALRETVEAIPDETTVELERAGEYDGGIGAATSLLSGRQRDALAAAVDVGYYEVPREGSLDAVADRLGCSAGTASEHLRKAESKLVRDAVGDGT